MRALVILGAVIANTCAAWGGEYLVEASGEACVHGLHAQPPGGPFSVFLFCDDGGGSNIGVIATDPGAGPGKIDLGKLKVWDRWDVNARFWQDPEWATDVTSFAWTSDLKSLYVATGEVYGTGALYRLNLVEKSSEKLFPTAEKRKSIGDRYSTSVEIKAVDPQTNTVTVELSYFSEASSATVVETIVVGR
ncbi:MAG: hypothetical protein IPK20_05030 [Betaproteobacteria bacterium]|nr:hypothetical protein [Betaproteobacteria bacterium]